MKHIKVFEQFVNEASKRDPESIRMEYKELKKMSTAELRKMWSLSTKIGNPKALDKEGLISDILHNKHGRKYVAAAFESVTEARSDFQVYHNQYSSAIDEIEKYAKKMGYELDREEYANAYTDAFFKPKDGQTKKDTLTLYKNGKEQRKALHVQIYGRGNKFELSAYIN